MYLSRVAVDTNNRQKISDLTHLGAYHNWVEQSFPNSANDRSRPRHLWRLDTLNGQQYLLVLSETPPDTSLLERYGIPDSAQVKSYDHLLDAVAPHARFRFRLTANPTHSVPQPDGRGTVYAHVTVAQQLQWLIDRAEKNGFHILPQPTDPDALAVDIVSRDRPILRHTHTKTVKLSRVSFEGMLEVTNVEMFKHLLIAGIGRERAYGMGLMTVIPLE